MQPPNIMHKKNISNMSDCLMAMSNSSYTYNWFRSSWITAYLPIIFILSFMMIIFATVAMCGTIMFDTMFAIIHTPTMSYQSLLMSVGLFLVKGRKNYQILSLNGCPKIDCTKYPKFPPTNIGSNPILANLAIKHNLNIVNILED